MNSARIRPGAWQAARVTEPLPQPAVGAAVTVTWAVRMHRAFIACAVLLLLAALMVVFGPGDDGSFSEYGIYFSLLLPTVAIAGLAFLFRAARHQPCTLTVAYPAVWFGTAGTPVVTELSRREGSMLRVSKIRRVLLLSLVRPDGSAPRQVSIDARVRPEVRAAALQAGWAWHEPPAAPEYPANWDPRPALGSGDIVALTEPAPATPMLSRRRAPTGPRLIFAVFFVAIYFAVYLGLPGVVAYLLTVLLIVGAVLVVRRRWPARPGQSLELTPDALRLILPQGVVVVPRADPAPVELSDTGLVIRGSNGRPLCRVHCPAALPAVRELLTRYAWPFTQSHTR